MLFEKVSITMLFFTETKVSLVNHFPDFSSTCCPTAVGHVRIGSVIPILRLEKLKHNKILIKTFSSQVSF